MAGDIIDIRARRGRPGLGERELRGSNGVRCNRRRPEPRRSSSRGGRLLASGAALLRSLDGSTSVRVLLMYSGLDMYEIGWEVRHDPGGLVDLQLLGSQKTVLVECKDFVPGDVNDDARKLRRIAVTTSYVAKYVLAWWRSDVPDDLADRIQKHYESGMRLDKNLTELVSHKSFRIFVPGSHESRWLSHCLRSRIYGRPCRARQRWPLPFPAHPRWRLSRHETASFVSHIRVDRNDGLSTGSIICNVVHPQFELMPIEVAKDESKGAVSRIQRGCLVAWPTTPWPHSDTGPTELAADGGSIDMEMCGNLGE